MPHGVVRYSCGDSTEASADGRIVGGAARCRQVVSALRQARARFSAIFRKRQLDREFDDEASSHIALATEDYVQRGMPLAEARRLARIRFGAIEASKDAYRDSRGLPRLEALYYDLRFALRALRRDRAFTLAAIAMLALAIGLNVTVFAIVNTILFRGFPLVRENGRLLYMQERYPSGVCCISYPDFEAWRSQAHSFEDMAFVSGRSLTFTGGDGPPLDTFTAALSSNAFGLLGVRPMLGRDFAPADETPGAPQAVILNYRFWQSRFHKRPDIIGFNVHINNAPAIVIGVMPEGFDFPEQHDMWVPLTRTPELLQPGAASYMAFGRLRERASLREARAELETINRRLAAVRPATNRGVVPKVNTYSQVFIGPDAAVIYGSLWAAAWFVLLIACANLTNLTLSRTIGRSREFSTRSALGAGRSRMIRQIFLESLLLAGAAAVVGWWIARWSIRTWAAATATRFQILDYRVTAGTLAYLAAVSIAAAILFSAAPIVKVLRLGVNNALKGDAPGVTQGRRGKHLAAVLVAGQMTLAIVLLSGAGVLVRSLLNIVGARTGVRDPASILVGSISLPSDKYPDSAARLRYFDRLEGQLRTIPGIQDGAVASSIPVDSGDLQMFEIEGRPAPPNGGDAAQFLAVDQDYFRVVGARAISGREFDERDRTAAPPVAIVNQSFAAKFLSDGPPSGRRIRALDRNKKPGEWRTVAGVVPNIMQGDPVRQQFKPLVYVPFRQAPSARAINSDGADFRGASFLLRASVRPNRVAGAVRAEIRKLDPDVLLENFGTLKDSFAFRRDRMDLEHAELGKHAAVAPIFAVIALLLAAIGLYAVIAHSIARRTKEIGVRMVIGATAGDIGRMVFRDGMSPVAIGTILGLMASLAVNRLLESQLVGISPYDSLTMTAAPALLLLIALLACRIPARRAMYIDPSVALRHD